MAWARRQLIGRQAGDQVAGWSIRDDGGNMVRQRQLRGMGVGWLVMDGWVDGWMRRGQVCNTELSLMQTLSRHRAWRGKGALFAF